MKLSTFSGEVGAFSGGLLAVGRYSDADPGELEKAVDAALGGALGAAAERTRFKGKPRSTVGVDTLGKLGVERVVLVGLGKRDEATALTRRDAAAVAVNAALGERYGRVGLALDGEARDVACGAFLGAYRYREQQTPDADDPPFEVAEVVLVGTEDDAGAERGRVLAEAVNLARTLVNRPPNVCTPEHLAEVAADIAKAPNFTATIFGWDGIRERKMGGIEAVSQGATREPRFIHLSYTPPGSKPEDAVALVGKGLTFDSGGLSLKPPKAQEEMYIDMAGSAAVLGAMRAVADLQPGVPVHGIVGACENMPGGNSYRPSDVITMYSGKTVEVLNTDAEGRLVLADCIHYATQQGPRCIVNLATLTGACMVALGSYYAGLFTDDDALAEELSGAAKRADEQLWRMPLDPKLFETLKSKRADLKNIGARWGGAITAAQFLQQFKGDSRWAHMDIAGPALAEKDDASVRLGGTGYGVLTLWSLIEG